MKNNLYDFVIVGAGSAGCVLAARLSEDASCKILVIEAGPDYPDFKTLPKVLKYSSLFSRAALPSVHNWAFKASVDESKNRMIGIPRGRATGGSSAIHGQIFLRGIPEDYDNWAQLGNSEWSFEKVLPYFNKCENDLNFSGAYHGKNGPMPVRRMKFDELPHSTQAFHKSCLGLGYKDDLDHNLPDSHGVGPRPINNIDGVRISTSIAYLSKEVRARQNLTIMARTLALKVICESGKAVGVKVETDGIHQTIFGNEIILSGGAISSPQLLMLSGIGPREELKKHNIAVVKDLPGVGKNLIDHPIVFMLFQAKGNANKFLAPCLQWELRTTSTNSDWRNDIQIHLLAFPGLREAYPLYRMARRRGVSFLKILLIGLRYIFLGQRSLFGFNVGVEKAFSQGEIKLESADPKSQPLINLRFLSHPKDKARMRYAVRLASEIWQSAPLSQVIKNTLISAPDEVLKSDSSLDQWNKERVETQHHLSGTCKMGPDSDPLSVVDQYGRVRGLENLRVVDASIMPEIISANTNATTIMIAEKIADFIKNQKK